MDYAIEKATALGMECKMISPIDTIEIKGRSILVKEVSLGTIKEAIQAHFEEFGKIKKILLTVVGMWEKAAIEFEEKKGAEEAAKHWSWLVGKDTVCVVPEGNIANTLESRDQFTLKLTHLPIGTTAYDIWDYVGKLGGMTCKIPRNPASYHRLRFAIVNFENEQDMNNALQDRPMFRNFQLQWTVPETPACRRCGDKNHTGKECSLKPNARQRVLNEPKFQKLAKLYERKHVPVAVPANFGGTSWAEVVKRNKIKEPTRKPPPRYTKEPDSHIEIRLARMEQAIDQILKHLKIDLPKEKTPPQELHPETTKVTEDRRTPEPKATKLDKGKGPETQDPILLTPLAIINTITKSNDNPEKKIISLSQAFSKYHQETSLRMRHLENNMADILSRFNEYSEAETETNPEIQQ